MDSHFSQLLSTTIATATAEVASNPIVAKQIFEPQISTETGIGIPNDTVLFVLIFKLMILLSSGLAMTV